MSIYFVELNSAACDELELVEYFEVEAEDIESAIKEVKHKLNNFNNNDNEYTLHFENEEVHISFYDYMQGKEVCYVIC